MAQPSFLKHAAIYAVGDILNLGAGFVLLPIYSRALKAEGFGSLELLERVGEVLTICLLARGIAQAVITLYAQSRDEAERRRVTAAGLCVTASVLVVGAVVAALGLGPLAGPLRLPPPLLVWTAVVTALVDGITVVVQATNQARLDSVFFAGVSLAQFLARIGLTLWFVVGLGWGLTGVVLAGLVRAVFFASLVVVREAWASGLGRPDAALIRQMFWFALPFLPTGVCMFLLNSGDRFFLKCYSTNAEVGCYGFGYKLATLVGFFSMTPLYRVWAARMHQAARHADAAEVFGRVTTRILAVYLWAGLGLCLFSDEIIRVFSQPDFLPALTVVPVIVLANWFQAAGTLMEGGFYVRRQPQWKVGVTLASSGLVVVLYSTLIPAYGTMGAAVATLGGFVFQAALTYWFAQRVFPVRYEFGRLAALLATTSVLWAAARWAPPGAGGLVVKIGLLGAGPLGLWSVGFFSAEEKRTVFQALASGAVGARSLVRRVRPKLREVGVRAEGL